MRANQIVVARLHYAPRATLCRVKLPPVRMVMGEYVSGLACAVPTLLNRDPTCAGEPSQHLGNDVPGKVCVEMGIGSTLSGYPRCTHWTLDAAPSPCCLQLDFLEFRDVLFPASGFQSVQFRIVEVSESSYERDVTVYSVPVMFPHTSCSSRTVCLCGLSEMRTRMVTHPQHSLQVAQVPPPHPFFHGIGCPFIPLPPPPHPPLDPEHAGSATRGPNVLWAEGVLRIPEWGGCRPGEGSR
jgi:hypothetical protein